MNPICWQRKKLHCVTCSPLVSKGSPVIDGVATAYLIRPKIQELFHAIKIDILCNTDREPLAEVVKNTKVLNDRPIGCWYWANKRDNYA